MKFVLPLVLLASAFAVAYFLGLFDSNADVTLKKSPRDAGTDVVPAGPKEKIPPKKQELETAEFVAEKSEGLLEEFGPDAPPVTLIGIVLNEAGPLAGATVELFENRALARQQVQIGDLKQSLTTDERGQFQLEVRMPSPDLILQARHPKHSAARVMGLNPADPSQRNPRLILSSGHSLQGHCFHRDGRPLGDVRVRVFDHHLQAFDPDHRLEQEAITGADGGWVVEGLLPGPKMVEATAPGLTTRQVQLVMVPREGGGGLRIDMDDGKSIEGSVFHTGLGTGAKGARIIARPFNALGKSRDLNRPSTYVALTDETGRFVLDGLSDGEFEVMSFGQGLVRGTSQRVQSGTVGLVLEVPPPLQIAGRVLTRGDGEPLTDFVIRIEPNPLMPSPGAPMLRVRDPEGRFRFDNAPPWPVVHLVVESPGRPKAKLGPLTTTNGPLENVIVEVPRGALVRGRVVDDLARPLAGLVVTGEHVADLRRTGPEAAFMLPMLNAGKTERRARTDAEGRFYFMGLEEGQWTFFVRSDRWFAPAPIQVRLDGEEERELETLHLSAGGSLQIQMTTEDETPDASGTVRLIGIDVQPFSEEQSSDAEGRIQFVGLRPGDYRYVVMRREGVADLGALLGVAGTAPTTDDKGRITIRPGEITKVSIP